MQVYLTPVLKFVEDRPLRKVCCKNEDTVNNSIKLQNRTNKNLQYRKLVKIHW